MLLCALLLSKSSVLEAARAELGYTIANSAGPPLLTAERPLLALIEFCPLEKSFIVLKSCSSMSSLRLRFILVLGKV